MNGVQATRETLGLVHDYLDAAIGDCSYETMRKTFPGSTIGSIIGIYAHALSSEDWAIQALMQGKPKLIESGDWLQRWGLTPPVVVDDYDWAATSLSLEALQEYGRAVYAATDDWLKGATDADLDKPIPWHSGPKAGGWVIADVIHVHLPFHAGEISALKGVMGLKGLPW
jgi:hypothetical protein